MIFQIPRKSFIILGILAFVIAVGALYINYFVPELKFGRINVISPYKSEAKILSERIADLNSFQVEGDLQVDSSVFGAGLKNINSNIFSLIDITNNKFKIDLSSFLRFNAISKRTYTLSSEIKRSNSEVFYLRFSKADIAPEVLVFIESFLNSWLRVDKNLMAEILAEEQGYDFSEEQFLEALRNSFKTISLFDLTRKISENHYSFNIGQKNLAEFLGNLFGDLSGQPFSSDELAAVEDSFYGFNINGEVWVNSTDGLPEKIKLNWNDFVTADLRFSKYNQVTSIKPPAKAVPLEKLLQ